MDTTVLVGLGNPGEQYAQTRHNYGRLVLHELVRRVSQTHWKKWQGNQWLELPSLNHKVIVFEPKDYMNISGINVHDFCAYFKLPVTSLVILHDDLDVELGTKKHAVHGSSGGHNGIQSLIDAFGTAEFVRIRLGIGRPANGTTDPDKISEYVLGRFPSDQADILRRSVDEAVAYLIESYKIQPVPPEQTER